MRQSTAGSVTRFLVAASFIVICTKGYANPFVTATPLPQPAQGNVWFVPLIPPDPNGPLPPEDGSLPATFPVPAQTPDVTFSTRYINFSSYGNATNSGTGDKNAFTIGSFLNSLGAVPPPDQSYSNIGNPILAQPGIPPQLGGGLPTADTPLLGPCAFRSGCISYGTYIEIIGQLLLTTDSHIKIAHDDGVSLKLNGLLVPGFTSQDAPGFVESYTYRGPSGLVNFDLVYAEAVVSPAYLQLAIPISPTLALFGPGLIGLGWIRRRYV